MAATDRSAVEGAGGFHATHWSVVLAAGDTHSPGSDAALEALCTAYWYPLYAFVRRRGYGPHEAEDLTQAFFTQLLSKRALGRADPQKGKFRSFLLASLENFLNNEWDKSKRLKRGGGAELFSFDGISPDERYRLEPVHSDSPEKIFERRWAEAVLEQVIVKLSKEYEQAGQATRFEALRAFLLSNSKAVPYAEAAEKLGLSANAVMTAVHRMRIRFRELFRAEIAQTVATSEEVQEEIRHLLAALSP